jgi:hypothetical protein
MKSITTKTKRIYPYLGINELEIIVLFVAKNTGIQVAYENYKLGGNKEVGEFSNSIDESSFQPFYGEVTLSN